MADTTAGEGFDFITWYRHMREHEPVFFDQEHNTWNLFRYRDVQRAESEYTTFSSQFSLGDDPPGLANSDPPLHRKLRTLVTQPFTLRRVAQLDERITETVHQLLDSVIATGRMDIVDDLAYPLPAIVIAELLGIPAEDRTQFKHWSNALTEQLGKPGGRLEPALQAAMAAYMLQIIEERRREPRNDLISGLLAAELDGEPLGLQDTMAFCILLLVAGNETTTNLITNAIICFDEHPDALEQLRAEPTLLSGAIEEVLRYRSPLRYTFRIAAKDILLDGQTIKKGQLVLPWLAAANRDEAEFPSADSFDIRRSPNRHLSFGHGIHFCLGAPLARLEAKIALQAMLDRLPEVKRVADVPLEPMAAPSIEGVRHLPITFRPTRATY